MSKIEPMSERLMREAKVWKYDGSVRPEFAEPTGPGQESVWDFPRPPFVEAMNQNVRIFAAGRTCGGDIIACTNL